MYRHARNLKRLLHGGTAFREHLGTLRKRFLLTLVELLSQKYTFFTEKCTLMILFFEVARLLGHLTPIFAPDF